MLFLIPNRLKRFLLERRIIKFPAYLSFKSQISFHAIIEMHYLYMFQQPEFQAVRQSSTTVLHVDFLGHKNEKLQEYDVVVCVSAYLRVCVWSSAGRGSRFFLSHTDSDALLISDPN